ncbi:UDP-3-O-(3-hydroxymyristoyl)glucosamine N-acyltransferase [Acidiferrobacter sp.]|jgi:UDP-3-O-[3-hydroxymyristoyl] glucosamine N-acyltransferase|uniref:UDP-3-O-(3-hydroxymyristoyl)glucosamine N-acyltransferase n=1 Tax=Acidiferrobacter sp. TaxID=1872107 RepID=UPI002633BBD2|nr:UDP-3-O-(3-hydroxymyristoyl)glucosamine N-acyltransferase [Acidiferrobacter sp.]
MAYTLRELADAAEVTLRGQGEIEIDAVAPLNRAGPRHVAYCASARYRTLISESRAGALILHPEDSDVFSGNALLCDDPRVAFARIARLLHPPGPIQPGRHPSAVIHESASVADSASIGAQAVIEAHASVGHEVSIGAGAVVGERCVVGAGTRIEARAVIMHDCVIGERCVISPGAVIGGEGFGYVREADGRWLKVPQLGRVVIGNEVDVGANTTIDRGALGDTVIADGVKLDNLIQIAHNVKVGEHTAMAGCVGVAGSAVIGKRCLIAGGSGIMGHITVGDDVEVTAMSFLKGSVTGPGRYSSSLPAADADVWARNLGRFRHLDELARRLRRVEQTIKQILSGGKH